MQTRVLALLIPIWGFSLIMGCAKKGGQTEQQPDSGTMKSIVSDPHSFARPNEARVSHLDLDISVNFSDKKISGSAAWDIQRLPEAKELILDTRGLEIQEIKDENGKALEWRLGTAQPWLGSPLFIQLGENTQKVVVYYQTGAQADALQWLDPVQTAGKKDPFLFTQSQAILARTWIPCQDSPGLRFTYSATVQVPSHLMAVMSATNPTQKSPDGKYRFEMKQRIPAYLMALAVGDLAFKPVGARTGVYAEPVDLERSVYEFGEMEDMLVAAEGLYGPYRWERYDLIVLPPSFPFGGMENPRLTFATPTILAGDRSLTSLVAHELAHSWSGNLVTNATWNDFWLNEGFTVYFERRIMEKLYGKDYADMLSVLGYQDLLETVSSLGDTNPDTQLKLKLDGRDADDGMSDIAYEKGNLFLCNIEAVVGREKWDAFLRKYFDSHAFEVMTTEEFIVYLNENLLNDPAYAGKVDVQTWVYAPGLPKGHVAPSSSRLMAADSSAADFARGTDPATLPTQKWATHEWQRFLRKLPHPLSLPQMESLDKAFHFSGTHNSEVAFCWFEHVIATNYQPGMKPMREFMTMVGRRKFVKPLYQELAETPSGLELAKEIYAKARPNYHAVTQHTLDEILNWDTGNQ